MDVLPPAMTPTSSKAIEEAIEQFEPLGTQKPEGEEELNKKIPVWLKPNTHAKLLALKNSRKVHNNKDRRYKRETNDEVISRLLADHDELIARISREAMTR